MERLERLFGLFPELAERRDQLAKTMSGGEQQMLAIARALMSEPKILLLDEPSLGLSPRLVKDLFSALRKITETGQAVLLVEQNAHQSLRLADYVYVLENGRIHSSGTPAEIQEDEVDPAGLSRPRAQAGREARISSSRQRPAPEENCTKVDLLTHSRVRFSGIRALSARTRSVRWLVVCKAFTLVAVSSTPMRARSRRGRSRPLLHRRARSRLLRRPRKPTPAPPAAVSSIRPRARSKPSGKRRLLLGAAHHVVAELVRVL